MIQQLIDQIESAISQKITGTKTVSGGDIAQAFQLTDVQNRSYFLKYLPKSNGLFDAEQDGLQRLRKAVSTFHTPEVILVGNNPSFLLLEWVQMRNSPISEQQSFYAGNALAELHSNTNNQDYFGLERDNFIGSISQPNTQTELWIDFFYENRGAKQLRLGKEKGLFSDYDLKCWAPFVKNYEQQLPPKMRPTLLHGDLWSGNIAYHPSAEKSSFIYDPAVYYGHPEMDLAMTKLFGGFTPAFYEGYFAKSSNALTGWENRLDFHQFYPILIHALLFGGSYVAQVKSLLKKYGN
jgi:fructosamine-3-kinase